MNFINIKMQNLLILTLIVSSLAVLIPRQKAPSFKGVAVTPKLEMKELSLFDFHDKYLILVFYPFDFTYVCPTELIAFSNAIEDFKKFGAEVVGISGDSQFTHMAWLKTPRNKGGVEGLQFPLIADTSREIARRYGVLVENPQDDLNGVALRGLVIIDRKGVIRMMQVNDAPVGRSVQETLRLLEAFIYTDSKGEVCPEGWKQGQNTIIPD